MELEVAVNIDSSQLMELYLNSLLPSSVASAQESLVTDIVAQPVIKATAPNIKLILFNIGKMLLATPLLKVAKILSLQEYGASITVLPYSNSYSCGLITITGKTFELIDIETLLWPKAKEYKAISRPMIADNKYLLLIADTAHAILCQEIVDFKDVALNYLQSRKNNYNCPWYIGNLLPETIPVLDLLALSKAIFLKKC